MIENIKLLGVNIKEYFWDIALLLFVGLITNYIFFSLSQPIHDNLPLNLPKSYDIFPLPIDFLKVAVWIISFLFIRAFLIDKVKTWLSIHYPYEYSFDITKNKLTDDRFIQEWLFQGNVQPINGGLLVSNANSGCLIKSKFNLGKPVIKGAWKDFQANIELEFPPQSNPINPPGPHNPNFPPDKQFVFEDYLGIIFRAQSFDDYLMLEITRIGKFLVVRPHIRLGGNWDAPILNIDTNSLPLLSSKILLNLIVKNNTITVSLGESSMRWLLPTHIETNLKQHSESDNSFPKKNEHRSKDLISETYFRNRSGMFGFRCYGNQIALIKSLNIFSN